jgi:hypothetical protein
LPTSEGRKPERADKWRPVGPKRADKAPKGAVLKGEEPGAQPRGDRWGKGKEE